MLRRGFATQQEIDACKAHRAKLGKSDPKTLLEILIGAKFLTNTQALRLIKELSVDAGAQKAIRIPGYEVLEFLGKGSMGMVYKARQTSVDRVVALKVLLDSLASNQEFIKRFKREAMVAAKLNHNHVVNVYDAGEAEHRHYFVMEYVEGTTVREQIDKRGRFAEDEGLRIILAVAEAMKHAHEKGLVHRDIKPDNIILTHDGTVKLADLGLARPTNDQAWAKSEAGLAIGTPYYISPEQVRGQTDIDIRADIYSLGATFYHMMTGQVPFEGTDPNEVMKKHVNKKIELVPPDHINTEISSGLGVVIETMMTREREKRYQNPKDLLLDLNALARGEPPVIADQGIGSLADLAEGEFADDGSESPYAANAGNAGPSQSNDGGSGSLMTILAIFLAISVVMNLVLLGLLARPAPLPSRSGSMASPPRTMDVPSANRLG